MVETGATTQETFLCDWKIVFKQLLEVLSQMNFKYGGIEYGPRIDYDGDLSFPDYEVFPGIYFPERKVNFLAKKEYLFTKPKIIYINIFQNDNSITLVDIAQSDPSLIYVWQNLLAHPGYRRFEENILSKLKLRLTKF